MLKQLLGVLIAGLLNGAVAVGQDYIITWKNDTIPCQLPGNIKETDLRPAWKYSNGHYNTVAVFQNDSVRVINAGEIKGYTRQKHGKQYLCNGFFESKQVVSPAVQKRTPVDSKANDPKNQDWFFMNRIVDGRYASLYMIYDNDGTCISAYYYIRRHDDPVPNKVTPVISKKKMVAFLSDAGIADQLKAFSGKRSNRRFVKIIREYNRLKEIAAGQTQP